MLKVALTFIVIMLIFSIFTLFLAAQFFPIATPFLFGQPKLVCKPCVCHPECHCETKCVQQQIMKECNFGVDTHNAIVSHHTQENRTTQFILIASLFVNFLQVLFLLLRKPIYNFCRARKTQQQQRKQDKHQALARRQAEQYCAALKEIMATPTEHLPTTPSTGHGPDDPSSKSLVNYVSNRPSAPSASRHSIQ